MLTTATFSLHCLGEQGPGLGLAAALAAARKTGVSVDLGAVSTTIEGSEDQVFDALRAAFETVVKQGDAMLVVRIQGVHADIQSGHSGVHTARTDQPQELVGIRWRERSPKESR